MSYTVNFGVITKRENSTSQTYTESISASCLLKESTDIISPTFSIQAQIVGDTLLPCNYMYVAAFNRYYWITNIEFYHGVWYVSGDTDVLATYKSDIGDTEAYILRAASTYNEHIADGFPDFENNPEAIITADTIGGFSEDGCVIIMTAGNDGQNSSSFYVMETSTWAKLYAKFFTNNFITDNNALWYNAIGQDLFNSIFNPSDFLSNAIWVPAPYISVASGESEVNIFLGVFDTGLKGKRLYPNKIAWSSVFQIDAPNHPQETTYGKWIRGNIATKEYLNIPGYGQLPIDSDVLAEAGVRAISGTLTMDCTGSCTYDISYNGKEEYLSVDLGVPCGFTDARNNIMNVIGTNLSIGTEFALGNAHGAMNTAISGLKSAFPTVNRVSSGGARILYSIQQHVKLVSVFYRLPTSISFATFGRPLCNTKKINTLSGYVLCDRTVSVSCSGTKQEIDLINQYLSGGFYYE